MDYKKGAEWDESGGTPWQRLLNRCAAGLALIGVLGITALVWTCGI